jgi:membrane associated rhomboid family serine protease
MIPVTDVIPSRTRPLVTVTLVVLNIVIFLLPAGVVPRNTMTAMFVHHGWLHLGSTMLYLWLFGGNVEDRLGRGRYLAFYLAAGLVASLAASAVDSRAGTPMVGASGAVAGVLGAYFVLYPQSRVLTLLPLPLMLFEIPAVFFLGVWFVAVFLGGLAHVAGVCAGFLAGAALVRLLQRPERARVEWWGP